MINPHFFKYRFISTLIFLFITLQPNTSYAAEISGKDTGTITADIGPDGNNLLLASGMLSISDPDNGEDIMVAATVDGNYGSLTQFKVGNWRYIADNSLSAIQNLASSATLTDTLTVSSVDGTTHNIVITIIGVGNAEQTNTAAVISGTDRANITADIGPDGNNLLLASGMLSISDPDNGEDIMVAATVDGNYGSLTQFKVGNWRYIADNSLSAIQNLASSATLTDTLTVSSVDGTTHNIVITIIGVGNAEQTNTAAVISGTDRANITADIGPDGNNLLLASGMLSISDPDNGEDIMVAATVDGNYGSLTQFKAGNWRYIADNSLSAIQNLASSATLTDTLTVSSVDGTTHNIVITIIGVGNAEQTNTAAVISGTDRANITADIGPDGNNLLLASGMLSISDPDNGEDIMVAATVDGNYGSLTQFKAGNWRYIADNSLSAIQNLASSATLTDTLTVSSVDGTTHNIVITIIGVGNAEQTNTAAVISGTDRANITADIGPDGNNLLLASGMLSISDPDNGEDIMVAATVDGNYGSLTQFKAGNWRYIADNSLSAIQNLASSATLTDTLTVSSVDGTTHNIVITIIGVGNANQTNAISLSWTAPSAREDNSSISLSEIAGYRIYYGTAPGDYINTVDINDGSVVKYTFDAFPSGTYYFVITTVDTKDRESLYSPEIIKVI